jgi:hypothetical protein
MNCTTYKLLEHIPNKITVFWQMTPCGLVEIYWRFGETYRVHFQNTLLTLRWTVFLPNTGMFLSDSRTSYPRRRVSSEWSPSQPQTSHVILQFKYFNIIVLFQSYNAQHIYWALRTSEAITVKTHALNRNQSNSVHILKTNVPCLRCHNCNLTKLRLYTNKVLSNNTTLLEPIYVETPRRWTVCLAV